MELGIDSQEFGEAMTKLFDGGIAYLIKPSKDTLGRVKISLYKEFIQKSLTPSTTTPSGPIRQLPMVVGSEKRLESSIPPMSTPLSDITHTQVSGPVSLPNLTIHPPGRIHRCWLHFEGLLNPTHAHLLRQAAQEGRKAENNRYGRLGLSTWAVSPHGKLRLFWKDPEKLTEALEEFGSFCKTLGFEIKGQLVGETECEIAYNVSGKVDDYAKCKIVADLDGRKVQIYFDKSLGKLEIEARVRGPGSPIQHRELTDMVLINGRLEQYVREDLPEEIATRVANKLLRESETSG